MNTRPMANPSSGLIAVLLVLWFVVAVAVGASGRLTPLRPPLPQVVIFGLTIASLAAVFLVPSLRAWADRVAVRTLVAVHLVRFIGVYFLLLARRGLLAPGFAIPAGWGDILVAVLALVLVALVPPDNNTRRRGYLAWNVLGVVDILFVVVNAARVGLADPASMRPLLQLPLSLLPTFIVPIIITTHVVLFNRLTGTYEE